MARKPPFIKELEGNLSIYHPAHQSFSTERPPEGLSGTACPPLQSGEAAVPEQTGSDALSRREPPAEPLRTVGHRPAGETQRGTKPTSPAGGRFTSAGERWTPDGGGSFRAYCSTST